jgi:hypothetical protein
MAHRYEYNFYIKLTVYVNSKLKDDRLWQKLLLSD